jgi:large subunit ribosomal protein L24
MKFDQTVSKQPRKKRKEMYGLAIHARKTRLRAHLGKELREKLGTRNITLRKGDKVKILKGRFAGVEGKVVEVNSAQGTIHVEGAVAKKQKGKEAFVPIAPSTVVITEAERKEAKKQAPKGAESKKGV